MLIIWLMFIITIFTINSLWYFYFIIELLWFFMLNLFLFGTNNFNGSSSQYSMNSNNYTSLALFGFIIFNSLISLALLFNLVLTYGINFLFIFLGKFGLLPFVSLIFNYISFVSVYFLINYLFLKLSYFVIYLILSTYLVNSFMYTGSLIYIIVVMLVISLIVLFLLTLSFNLISFNLYSIISSSFNYFIILIIQSLSYNAYSFGPSAVFTLLYIYIYTWNSYILYYLLSLFVVYWSDCPTSSTAFGSLFNYSSNSLNSMGMSPASRINSFNLIDIVGVLSPANTIFYTSIFVYLFILVGLIPLFIFFIKLFYIVFISEVSIAFIFLFSFIIFALYSYLFLSLILHSSFLISYSSYFNYYWRVKKDWSMYKPVIYFVWY